ncbi:MAG: large extracellular alpha-helical protein [Desulfamplus sp.]|nr:large extracellular alpha-helical protein [Desulfamplus sp.]
MQTLLYSIFTIILLNSTIFCINIVCAALPQPLTIKRILPSGEDIQNDRQILIQFSRAVVPIGRMERKQEELPIKITTNNPNSPELKGQWRWLNPTDLAFNLDATSQMLPATRYTITINPGVTTQDGATLAEPFIHTFITKRPAISYYQFETWRSPVTPVIALHFNQPVTKDSVVESLYFAPVNQPENRYPILVESHQSRDQLKNQSRNQNIDQNLSDIQAALVWCLSPVGELPQDSTISLIANPGISSSLGGEKSVDTREVVRFDTFPEPKFAGIRCYTIKDDNPITISPEDSASGKLEHIVDPRGYTELLFTAPMEFEQIRNNLIFLPDLAQGQKNYDPWANGYNSSYLNYPHTRGEFYSVAIPQYLKAWQQYTIVEKSLEIEQDGAGLSIIKDVFGRHLISPINFTFYTDHRKPTYQILHQTGVLEKDIDSEVPLAITNIDKMTIDYKTLTKDNELSKTSTDMNSVVKSDLRVQDVSYLMQLGVRQMLNGKSGAVYGKVTSTSPAVDVNQVGGSHFFTVVSPWQIHAKMGHFSSLVWVTSLVTGEPVPDVVVTVHRSFIENLTRNSYALCQSTTDENGIATLPGMVSLDPKRETFTNSWEYGRERLIIKAATNSDLAILPLTYRHDFSISAWRVSEGNVSSYSEPQYAHIHSWGTTPQGIYKAGDTIDYKIYVRDQNNSSFVLPPISGYKLVITDPTGKNIFEQKDITLSEFGAFHGQYNIPKNGAVGWYQFYLSASFSEYSWEPLKVLVTDFTPSPFKVLTELNGDHFKPQDTLHIETSATLHAGSPYSDAPVRVTVRLKEENFQPDNPITKGFTFYRAAGGGPDDFLSYQKDAKEESDVENSDSYEDEYISDAPETLLEKRGELDNLGIIKNSLVLSNISSIPYGKIEVESSVQDDNGRFVSNSKRVTYLGRDLFIGLKSLKWVYEAAKPAIIQAIAVDGNGNLVKDRQIKLSIQHRVTKAARIKGAGNAYLTKYINEWVVTEEKTLISTLEPLEFDFNPSLPGDYRVVAMVESSEDKIGDKVEDKQAHISSISTWVTGKGQVLWQEPDDFSLSIIPEQESYKVGDRAKYLIKNPFPNAYALISVERYGILRQWVEQLQNSTQVVEVEIMAEDVPGFFLSVTIISPRVGAGGFGSPVDIQNLPHPPQDGVDLAKPTFRLGYVKTSVKELEHDIKVAVTPEQLIYKPAEVVKVKIHAEALKNRDEKIEFAVAVLDEAVFDLISSGRDHFDIFKGFNILNALDVENYSLLTNMIGRRKFEKKGANVGGDGGAGMKMRSSFKYVSYWNPSIIADKNGDAAIEFKAPDNLTGWKIFVMAVTPTDSMGLGEANFKVNRATEIRPVMPNQVTEGDSFEAGFSVMNRTDKARYINVSIKAKNSNSDNLNSDENKEIVLERQINLLPFKRETIFLPITAKLSKSSEESGTIRFIVQAQDDFDGDALTHTLEVNKKHSFITALNYGIVSNKGETSEKLLYPENIYPDISKTIVTLYPTVIGNIEQSFKYMAQYPYGCWEQKLSKALMASHFMELNGYFAKDSISWEEAESLPEKTLLLASQFQAPNGGFAYFTPDDGYVCPYLSAYTALAFGWLKSRGFSVPKDVEDRLFGYLSTLVRKDIFPMLDNGGFYSNAIRSTVRAVALCALAKAGKAGISEITRYEPHLNEMSLFGKALFLMAAVEVKGGESIAKRVWDMILSSANFSSGKVVFSESLDSDFSRILESPTRTQGAILSAVIKFADRVKDADDIAFKLVRTITETNGRANSGYNTQESIFCLNALVDYSAKYESVEARVGERDDNSGDTLDIKAILKIESSDEEEMGVASFKDIKDLPVTFTKKITKAELGKSADIIIMQDSKPQQAENIDNVGNIYYLAGLKYAPKDDFAEPINSGIEVRREYSVERDGRWVLLNHESNKDGEKIDNTIKRGDLVRVDIFLSLPTARNFPVVSDPVPGGFEPVNRELATASIVDAQKADSLTPEGSWWFKLQNWYEFNQSRWSFYHQELGHKAVRYYADYLPAGNYHLSYTLQAIAQGSFAAMPIYAEEMYNSDIFGRGVAENIVIF